jgi:murein DD-endopeptidase MepM/ murein hydrolase activator NlpD
VQRRWWIGIGAGVLVAALAAFLVGRGSGSDRAGAHSSAGPATTATPSTAAPTTAGAPTTAAPTTAAPSTASSTPPSQPARTSYAFPVQPVNAADYPGSHHDYPAADIFAACGTTVVAPTSGVVQEVTLVDVWSSNDDDPATRGGISVAIVGDDGVRYYGSHLSGLEPSIVPGARVATGTVLGRVGRTGNAAGTPCHLHFGISTPCGPGDVLRRRGEFWPQPHLDDWAVGGQSSPADLPDPSTC